MPLTKSSSKQAFSANVSAERNTGKPMKQALAIVYDVQRRAHKADGGGVPFYVRSAAHDLAHSGMIHSPVPGRTDRINMGIKPGGYVVPADIVSSIGQGNSIAGGHALSRLFGMAPGGASVPHPHAVMSIPTRGMMQGRKGFADGGGVDDQPPVDVVAAGGEFVVPNHVVQQIGSGDVDHGHEILDHFVKKVRAKTIKTLRKLPGPTKN